MRKNLDKDYEIDLIEFLLNLLQKKFFILFSAFIFMLILAGYRYTLEEKNKEAEAYKKSSKKSSPTRGRRYS